MVETCAFQINFLKIVDFADLCSLTEKMLTGFEINKWGHVFPKHYIALSMYGHCIDTMIAHFQYPPSISVLVGHYLVSSTFNLTMEQYRSLKEPDKIKSLQSTTEKILLLGLDQQNLKPLEAKPHLEGLLKTLVQICNQTYTTHEPLSPICSTIENQWIQQSSNMMKAVFQACPEVGFQTSASLQAVTENKYDLFQMNLKIVFSWWKRRMELMLSHFGDYTLNMENLQIFTFCMFTKGEAFGNFGVRLAWLSGADDPRKNFDKSYQHLSTPKFCDFLTNKGVFVYRKKEKMLFKEVQHCLNEFIEDDDIAHLLFMTILFNSNETRSLQKQYQHLLVKKLAEVCSKFGAENGDDAFVQMNGLLSKFIMLIGRFKHEAMKIIGNL